MTINGGGGGGKKKVPQTCEFARFIGGSCRTFNQDHRKPVIVVGNNILVFILIFTIIAKLWSTPPHQSLEYRVKKQELILNQSICFNKHYSYVYQQYFQAIKIVYNVLFEVSQCSCCIFIANIFTKLIKA